MRRPLPSTNRTRREQFELVEIGHELAWQCDAVWVVAAITGCGVVTAPDSNKMEHVLGATAHVLHQNRPSQSNAGLARVLRTAVCTNQISEPIPLALERCTKTHNVHNYQNNVST